MDYRPAIAGAYSVGQGGDLWPDVASYLGTLLLCFRTLANDHHPATLYPFADVYRYRPSSRCCWNTLLLPARAFAKSSRSTSRQTHACPVGTGSWWGSRR